MAETATAALSDFLLARIAEDEAAAPYVFAEQFTPARIRAECEAKRRVVEIAGPAIVGGKPLPGSGIPDLLAALALPYANHPDYRDGWRP